MSKAPLTSLTVLCAAMAACADPNRTVTAPHAPAALSEAPADLLGGATVDGPFDVTFAPGAPSKQQMAASARAATDGRTSGQVSLTLGSGFFTNIASERYSFVAFSTKSSASPAPFVAKGQYEMTLTTAAGVVQEFRGEVICMCAIGNTARLAGRLTSVVIDGVPRPINPAASHNIWSVTDGGDSPGTTDTGSPMIFFSAAAAPLHCSADFIPPQFANEEGDVQVRP